MSLLLLVNTCRNADNLFGSLAEIREALDKQYGSPPSIPLTPAPWIYIEAAKAVTSADCALCYCWSCVMIVRVQRYMYWPSARLRCYIVRIHVFVWWMSWFLQNSATTKQQKQLLLWLYTCVDVHVGGQCLTRSVSQWTSISHFTYACVKGEKMFYL